VAASPPNTLMLTALVIGLLNLTSVGSTLGGIVWFNYYYKIIFNISHFSVTIGKPCSFNHSIKTNWPISQWTTWIICTFVIIYIHLNIIDEAVVVI
jgi:hypothetical protein